MAADRAASELREQSALLAWFRQRDAQAHIGRLVIESQAMWTQR